uniref:(northern house mosquito) hypothetical protein n=1 Tax=Culex pipiens TaxID=7175 RepID=A0A8D8L0K6_CULPI
MVARRICRELNLRVTFCRHLSREEMRFDRGSSYCRKLTYFNSLGSDESSWFCSASLSNVTKSGGGGPLRPFSTFLCGFLLRFCIRFLPAFFTRIVPVWIDQLACFHSGPVFLSGSWSFFLLLQLSACLFSFLSLSCIALGHAQRLAVIHATAEPVTCLHRMNRTRA